MNPRAGRVLLILVVLAVTGCDQATKHLAERELADGPAVLVRDHLELTVVRNPGVAFNVERVLPAPARRPVALAVGLVLLPLLVLLALRSARAASPWLTAGYALVLAGALGNLLDRVTRGSVVDFVHAWSGDTHFPVFNVADVAICLGVPLLFIASRRAGARSGAPSRPA
ncbi:MAG TPA: signal peptidase II [Kofleriaceae bacterium]|nr:signal peptidase II [Kofleriaceae bacterium]